MSRTKLKPRRIGDYSKPYRDALAYWCSFRNLGFAADEIFFGFGVVDGQPDWVHLQLQTQGKTFTVIVAQLPGAKRQKVMSTWYKFATLARDSTELERNACYKDHLLGQSLDYYSVFVLSIEAVGITVPELLRQMPHAGQA